MGATISDIVTKFSFQFIKLILIANIIAWPVAYFAMNEWLSAYAYKIEIGFSTFIISSVTAILVALLTVGFQAIKASLLNPVDSIKYE